MLFILTRSAVSMSPFIFLMIFSVTVSVLSISVCRIKGLWPQGQSVWHLIDNATFQEICWDREITCILTIRANEEGKCWHCLEFQQCEHLIGPLYGVNTSSVKFVKRKQNNQPTVSKLFPPYGLIAGLQCCVIMKMPYKKKPTPILSSHHVAFLFIRLLFHCVLEPHCTQLVWCQAFQSQNTIVLWLKFYYI